MYTGPPPIAAIYPIRYYSPMNTVRSLRSTAGMTQAQLAKAAGTSQPTVAAYEAGRKSPTLSTLERLARAAGLEALVVYHPPMTREEGRSLALHHVIADRLEADPEGVTAVARDKLKTMRVIAPTSQPLREWVVLLDRPVSALIPVLRDPSPWGRELRHVTPFAGVLSVRERAEVMRTFAAEAAEGL